MNLLLDTHAFLWFCQNHPMLSPKARTAIEDPMNRKWVSTASCWEIAIKAGLGKLNLGEPSTTYLQNALAITKFELLPIRLSHVTSVESFPIHHRDPFDRLLIAQAMIEDCRLVSDDSILIFIKQIVSGNSLLLKALKHSCIHICIKSDCCHADMQNWVIQYPRSAFKYDRSTEAKILTPRQKSAESPAPQTRAAAVGLKASIVLCPRWAFLFHCSAIVSV